VYKVRSKILLIDDDANALHVTSRILARLSVDVTAVSSAKQGLQTADLGEVALILVDLNMPEMSGLEFIRELRSSEHTKYVPVIFITGADYSSESKRAAYDLGAVDFLHKPVDSRVLRSKASVFVDLHQQRMLSHMSNLAVSALREGIVITDPRQEDNPIVYCNEGFATLFGYDRQEILGKNCRFLQGPETSGETKRRIGEAVAEGRSIRTEIVNYRKDGSTLWNLLSITPVFGHDGQLQHFIGIQQDITAEKRAVRLEQERTALQDSVKAFSQVLTVASHELRTPLAGIRAMAELLLSGEEGRTEAGQKFLKGISDESLKMGVLINNLLDAARLNSGTMQWNWSAFHPVDCCREAVETAARLIDRERVRLELMPAEPDLSMKGDPEGIKRLLLNLLSNAQKHTREGAILVSLERVECRGMPFVVLEVVDSGEGIAAEYIGRAGEAFALSSGLIGENHSGGPGLGLALCKGIAAAHGGRLEISSSPGKGTAVRVFLRQDLETPIVVTAAGPLEWKFPQPPPPQ
jgi:PAS domain S-box-containing protein